MHLTEEQHRAIEAAQGRPVEIVDPRTNRIYVLVPAEEYQRVRELRSHEPAATGPAGKPAYFPKVPGLEEGKPMRVHLRSLPTPPEVVERAKEFCKYLGLWRKKLVKEVEDEAKL